MAHYDEHMTADPEDLRQAMRQWATGVTIVTVLHEGRRHGMTVSSFTSVSLDPPLVLVSLERVTNTHRLVQAAGTFGITILDQSKQEISDRFAGRITEFTDRFAGLETFTLVSGAPLLAHGALAWFDCRVVVTYQAGNHTVFIAEVLAVKLNANGGKPLIYFNRDYRRLDLNSTE
jgi:flavin reductase (DIM6/NTAB) family NADH-FMN oxidoreductase RutF